MDEQLSTSRYPTSSHEGVLRKPTPLKSDNILKKFKQFQKNPLSNSFNTTFDRFGRIWSVNKDNLVKCFKPIQADEQEKNFIRRNIGMLGSIITRTIDRGELEHVVNIIVESCDRNNKKESHFKHAIKLVDILFNNQHHQQPHPQRVGVAVDDPNSVFILQREQITLNSKLKLFFESLIKSKIYLNSESRLISSDLKEIIELVQSNETTKASFLAIEKGYSRLATLLAQGGGDAKFQEFLRSQVDIWSDNGQIAYIDSTLVIIYLILGNALFLNEPEFNEHFERHAQNNDNKITHLLGTYLKCNSWAQNLSLLFFYGSFHNQPFNKTMEIYKNAMSDFPDRFEPPIPYYQLNKETDDEYEYDVIYRLLMLADDPTYPVSKLFEPIGCNDNALDAVLSYSLAFILNKILEAQPAHPLSNQKQDLDLVLIRLTSSLTYQLSSLNLFKFNIDINLMKDSFSLLESLIMDIIDDDGGDIDINDELNPLPFNSTYQQLIRTTGLDPVLFYSSRSSRSLYLNQPNRYFLDLLSSNQLYVAHQVLLYQLLPTLILKNDMLLLSNFIGNLSEIRLSGTRIYLIRFKLYSEIMTLSSNSIKILKDQPKIIKDANELLTQIQRCLIDDVFYPQLPPTLSFISNLNLPKLKFVKSAIYNKDDCEIPLVPLAHDIMRRDLSNFLARIQPLSKDGLKASLSEDLSGWKRLESNVFNDSNWLDGL